MLGSWEWIIILVIVLLLFGVGRISQVMAELGKGVRAFREGLQGDDDTSGSAAAGTRTDDAKPAAEK